MAKLKVLIVDDSAVVRTLLTEILSSDPGIEVVGTAGDPFRAREKIRKLEPDVITLDVEMPKMDGISFLEKLMRLHPMPVVMISSMTQKGADIALRAIELGAFDFVGKPRADMASAFMDYQDEIVAKVKEAAKARYKIRKNFEKSSASKKIVHRISPVAPGPKLSSDAILEKSIAKGVSGRQTIIAIGASTGGTEAIRRVLEVLPAQMPAIVITQHIPPVFSESFANRMDSLSLLTVKEAVDDESILPGHVYIAPGDKHLLVEKRGAGYVCRLNDGPAVNRHKPSVDVLFRSVANVVGQNAMGIIMTGMGADGALGLLEMKDRGAYTVAQDEQTSVVWGMPGEAVKKGAANYVLALDKIAAAIVKEGQRRMVKETSR